MKPITTKDIERQTRDRAIKEKLSRIKRKILVMSGKGGVGKSTLAAYLALMLSRQGHRVGLLDVDLHGPSIPRLLKVSKGLEMTAEGKMRPCAVSGNLLVMSIEMVLGDKDTAIIWRGPLKISAIKQFISDIEWGDLDYLVIDSPPGTGDEPLTVAQTIEDVEALVVTTPQEVSLADVRKSINFCRQLNIPILGVVENMSGLICPHCGKEVPVFGAGGGARMAEAMQVPLLGEIPIDPLMVELGDRGELEDLLLRQGRPINNAYQEILRRMEKG